MSDLYEHDEGLLKVMECAKECDAVIRKWELCKVERMACLGILLGSQTASLIGELLDSITVGEIEIKTKGSSLGVS
jgi:hypothetical protein